MSGIPELRETRIVRPGGAARRISLSLVDAMRADISTSVVFFYERALDDALLADGLARALDHVPAFGGRLQEGEGTLDIVCENQGVPLTTFEVGDSLDDAIGRVTLPGAGLADHVNAPLARQGELPLLTARASRLAGGGMALGCSWHHAVGDMSSFMLFMKAWSAAVGGLPLPEVLLVDDRDAYLDEVLPEAHSDRPGIRLLDDDEAAGRVANVRAAAMTSRTIQIYFGEAEADRMRQELGTASGQQLSMTDVLCASVVTAVRQLDDDQQDRNLAMAVDVRHRLELPPYVIGNLVSDIYLSCPAGAAPHELAAQIRRAVSDINGSHLSIRASRAFLDKVGRSRIGDCVPVGFDLSRRTFTFSSWRRFGVYDIAFEGQAPAYFSPAINVQLPWTSWLVEGFGGDGFLVTVVLPAKLAAKLKSPEGRAALHRCRAPDDRLPGLAVTARKLL